MTDWFTHTYSFTHWHVSNLSSDQYFDENDQALALFMEREASGTIFVKIKQGWFQTKLGCSIDRPTRSRALIFSDQDILSLQLLAPDHHRHHHRHRQHRHRDCHPRHRHHHHSLIIVIVMVIIYLDIFFFCIEKYSRESVVQTTIFLLLPYCWILCLHKSEDLWNAFALPAFEASFAIHNWKMEGDRTNEIFQYFLIHTFLKEFIWTNEIIFVHLSLKGVVPDFLDSHQLQLAPFELAERSIHFFCARFPMETAIIQT